MNAPTPDFVMTKPRKYNEGYMPGFSNDFGARPSKARCPLGRTAHSAAPIFMPSSYRVRRSLRRVFRTNAHGFIACADGAAHLGHGPVRSAAFSLGPHGGQRPAIGADALGSSPIPEDAGTWLEGMRTIFTGGDVLTQVGYAIHTYAVTESRD